MSIFLEHKLVRERTDSEAKSSCFHCGENCETEQLIFEDKQFCCLGCKTVYELLSDNNLDTFYRLEANPGRSLRSRSRVDYSWLDEEEAVDKISDYHDERILKVTFELPQIHCTSCVWLLEHLYRLDAGVLRSQINFPEQKAHFQIDPGKLSLRGLVELLNGIGYAPRLQLDRLSVEPVRTDRSLSYQLGVAGFVFGNIMLFSFPEYFGLGEIEFQRWFGYFNIFLSIPVVLYSARSYWKSAFLSLRQLQLNIDVPISLGILVLFLWSIYEILSQTGAGYLDSLAGLVFFLLIGRWFQQQTYHRLSFERNYKSYFPIAVLKAVGNTFKSVTLDRLEAGDIVCIQNNGLLPADGELLSDAALLDYSFVTGEAVPVPKKGGDKVFAGGRQLGGQIEVQLSKAVSQSYLTQLWNDDAFKKEYLAHSSQLLSRVGKYFTPVVLMIALSTFAYWWPIDHRIAIHAFTAVLIIACPCALALSVPFTLGNTLRLLARHGIYVKNTATLEALNEIDTIVFDKTGTLTSDTGSEQLSYLGQGLSLRDKNVISSLARQSSHPVSRQLAKLWPEATTLDINEFEEMPGKGISGMADGQSIQIGSAEFLGIKKQESGTWVKIREKVFGPFIYANHYRSGIRKVLENLAAEHELFLLSGDHDDERSYLEGHFAKDHLYFEQSPHDKLLFIKSLQAQGTKVMMIGDGLNDAGALQQSDVGIVVTEDINNFTPACDIILGSERFQQLARLTKYVRQNIHLVYGAILLALLYNIIGLSFAVQGLLSPLIAAILMPLSSISIALFGVSGSTFFFRRFDSR